MTTPPTTVRHTLHGRLVYPTALRFVGEQNLSARMNELAELERASSRELALYQGRRLAAMLTHAASTVPYYRSRWNSALTFDGTNAMDQLQQLPFVTKTDLQSGLGALLSTAFSGRVSRKITGGSTGQAVTVIKDRTATAAERAAMWLGYGWFGVVIGDRVARFWGAPTATKRKWITRLADFAMHRIRFSAFAFTETDLERYWRTCLRFRPEYFHGYVSMLEAFAAFVSSRGYDGTQLRLKSIIATSEVLSQPQRQLIERTFGAPIQIEYGCGEAGPIAYECEHGSLHLMTADLVVEFLSDTGTPVAPGELGEIVITDLNNRAMPLIRYRLGDFGVAGAPCACGRSFPVLERIVGRAYDFVQDLMGRRYHGEFFMYIFEDLRAAGHQISGFQVIQDSPGKVHVLLVPSRSNTDVVGATRSLLAARLPDMQSDVATTASISRARSGKMQVIRNLWAQSDARPTSPE